MKFLCTSLLLLAALALSGCSTVGESSSRTASPSAINLQQMQVRKGTVGRRTEFPLRAKYITVHSTSNRGATALQHARGMANGAFRGRSRWNRTGYVTWHFTVDDRVAIQSLPLNIQGEHADHDGPGNRSSIAIEICEFRDARRQAAAVDRAARLTAWLLNEKGLSLSRVVPHYHWPQHRFGGNKKPCPRIFMTRGRPGPRWQQFLRKVDGYR
ncbi:MAG TPA: N-acetylmuramoyl-L-alanine amidase [Chthoniobacteraceae bacterium]|nr:N-acetylmuramoyl-L-alanine amidase [Chthoniobacteraceae bacterium]